MKDKMMCLCVLVLNCLYLRGKPGIIHYCCNVTYSRMKAVFNFSFSWESDVKSSGINF